MLACGLLTACSEADSIAGSEDAVLSSADVIRVGGVNADGLVAHASVTRADDEAVDEETVTSIDAEKISWLKGPLVNGLNITYGLSSDATNTKDVAVLKLTTSDGTADGDITYSEDGTKKYAVYTFNYKDETKGKAKWYGNGAHYFEGTYVPSKLYTSVPSNLTTDQSDDNTSEDALGNYTLLSHYLAMPSNYTINATVARIKLPFRHRLARVLAYILIDPDMGSDVKIEGYKSTSAETTEDDPKTSKIRFCNVEVLSSVAVSGDNNDVYTPQWTNVRKAVPHFVGERGSYNDKTNEYPSTDVEENFIAYYNIDEKVYIYPTDTEWSTLKDYNYDSETKLSDDGKYKIVSYGKVPVYDMIVRPTYTSASNVMYDEASGVTNSVSNEIDFDITLNNGLHYTKNFIFDLNADYQTVVYLHISKEAVDYNSSGSELWVNNNGSDDYYGVNNQNGNNLSIAGCGWQRAYTNSETNYKVTDGHQYLHDSEDEYAQYVTDAKWIEMLREACEGGDHHGDYFILKKNISIPAAAFPENFVFTGHLDGQDYTITLTDASYTPAHDAYETYDNSSYTKYILSGTNYVEFTPADNTTYYQKSGDTYTAINDISAYSGSTAYTRTENAPTYSIVSKAWELSSGSYYKKNGSSYEAIEDITTYLGAFNNNIYTRQQNADSYTAVSSPSGNPHEQGWYELNGTTYSLTEDTTVNTGKTYYTKDEVSYTYTAVSNVTTLDSSVTYYYKDGDNYVQIDNLDDYIGVYSQVITYNYTAINFYKFVHHESVIGSSTEAANRHLFAGLNGTYEAAKGVANVHEENGILVPTSGWRAEVMNLNVKDGTLFPSTVYDTTNKVYTTAVTGYVHNCWEGSTYDSSTHKWSGGSSVPNNTPSIPQY